MLTVVAPVHNEQDVLPLFIERTIAVLDRLEPFELILVDDGSTDGSYEILRQAAETDPRIRVIRLSRNFGHQIAITAGLDAAQGQAVVLIDSDLQDPPEVIPQMVEKWREGNEVVYGVRTARAGESRLKLLTAGAFYRVIGKISDTDLPPDSGDFRLLDRKVVDVLATMREESRYLRGMVSWVGYRQCALPYERHERSSGQTSFTLRKMVAFASDAITSFSDRPLRIAMRLGLVITVVAFGFLTWIVIGRLINPDATPEGLTSLLVAILFLGGVELMAIGILGSYVGRIYREAKRRPLYAVAETLGGQPAAADDRSAGEEPGPDHPQIY